MAVYYATEGAIGSKTSMFKGSYSFRRADFFLQGGGGKDEGFSSQCIVVLRLVEPAQYFSTIIHNLSLNNES